MFRHPAQQIRDMCPGKMDFMALPVSNHTGKVGTPFSFNTKINHMMIPTGVDTNRYTQFLKPKVLNPAVNYRYRYN
jgi:hypothetical protein